MSGATPNAVATACTPANGEDKEFLADLADQLATSQVATEVADVAQAAGLQAKQLPFVGAIADRLGDASDSVQRFRMRNRHAWVVRHNFDANSYHDTKANDHHTAATPGEDFEVAGRLG